MDCLGGLCIQRMVKPDGRVTYSEELLPRAGTVAGSHTHCWIFKIFECLTLLKSGQDVRLYT
jgi:hypothetical protein